MLTRRHALLVIAVTVYRPSRDTFWAHLFFFCWSFVQFDELLYKHFTLLARFFSLLFSFSLSLSLLICATTIFLKLPTACVIAHTLLQILCRAWCVGMRVGTTPRLYQPDFYVVVIFVATTPVTVTTATFIACVLYMAEPSSINNPLLLKLTGWWCNRILGEWESEINGHKEPERDKALRGFFLSWISSAHNRHMN